MMDDDLYARLRAANPVPGTSAVEAADSPRTHQLMEAAMSTNATAHTTEEPERAQRRSRFFPIGVAAAAAGVIVAGSLLIPDLFEAEAPSTLVAPLTLALPGSDISTSCAPVSVDVLSSQELAFAATATAVGDGTVDLTVDDWFKGGAATEVQLTTGPELVGYSIDFQQGDRYLVTATGGSVSICGLSGAATPELQELYDEAFAG